MDKKCRYKQYKPAYMYMPNGTTFRIIIEIKDDPL